MTLVWSDAAIALGQRPTPPEKLELGLTSLQLTGSGRGRPLEDRLSSRAICDAAWLTAFSTAPTAVLTLVVSGTVSPLDSSHVRYFPLCSKAASRLKFGWRLRVLMFNTDALRAEGSPSRR